MNIDIGAALEDAVDRLATPVGALLAVLFAVAGIVQAIAITDLLLGVLDSLVTFVEQTDPQAAEQMRGELETVTQETIAVGLGAGPAALLWLVGFLGSLSVLVVAIDAFARGVDQPAGLGPDGFGWKLLNVALGWIVWGLVVALTIWLLGLGLVLGALLAFFPVAVVRDGEWFGAAYASSVGFFTDNFGAAALTIGVVIAVYVGRSVFESFLSAIPSAIASTVTLQLLGGVVWTFVWALLTVVYVAGDDASAGSDAVGEGADASGRQAA